MLKSTANNKKLSKIIFYLILIVVVVCWRLITIEPAGEKPPAHVSEKIYVTFIDVGQGDCTLIKSPNGKYMLIDAGTTEAGHKICDYLEDSGVQEIEYFILSHPHEDHIGSADKVLDNFKVNNVIMTDKEQVSFAFDRLVSSLWNSKNTNGTKINKPKTKEIFDFDGIKVEILSDGMEYYDLNDTSIVVRINYYETSLIVSGDAGKKVEKQILSDFENVSAQLYKCAHHGSSTSNSKKFLNAVKPEFAVVCCGLDNIYGHPHEETIKLLYDQGVDVYRTDENGDIVFVSDGSKFELFSISKDLYDMAA